MEVQKMRPSSTAIKTSPKSSANSKKSEIEFKQSTSIPHQDHFNPIRYKETSKIWVSSLKKSPAYAEIADHFKYDSHSADIDHYYHLCSIAQSILGIKIPESYLNPTLTAEDFAKYLTDTLKRIATKIKEITNISKAENEILEFISSPDIALQSEVVDNPSFISLTEAEQIKLTKFCKELESLAKDSKNFKSSMTLLSQVRENMDLLSAILQKTDLNQVIGVNQKELWSCSVLSVLVKSIQTNSNAVEVDQSNPEQTEIKFPASKFKVPFYARNNFIHNLQANYGIIVKLDENLYVSAIVVPNETLKKWKKSTTRSEAMIPQAAITGIELFFALYKNYGNTIKPVEHPKPLGELHEIYEESFLHNGINILNVGELLGCDVSYIPTKNIDSINNKNFKDFFILYDSKYRNKIIRDMHYSYLSFVNMDKLLKEEDDDNGLITESDDDEYIEKPSEQLVINTLQGGRCPYKPLAELTTKKYVLLHIAKF